MLQNAPGRRIRADSGSARWACVTASWRTVKDLPEFGEQGEGHWDSFARINTTTRSCGIVGVFRQNAAESSGLVVVKGLDPKATYAVCHLVDGAPIASATGVELA